MWRNRRTGRRRSWRLRAFGIGLAVALLSVVTCSAGVTVPELTAEYGPPLPATTAAANRFIERTLATAQGASANRRFRISVAEDEATSVVALGLMLPELLEAANRLPPDALRKAQTVDDMREILRRSVDSVVATAGLMVRIADWFNPHLRTSDAQLRFTDAGEIVMASNFHAWRFRLPMLFVVKPRANPGELEFVFVKGRVGRVGAPQWAFNASGRLFAAALLKGRNYAEISHLLVGAKQLTVEVAWRR